MKKLNGYIKLMKIYKNKLIFFIKNINKDNPSQARNKPASS